MSSVVVVA